MVSCLSHGNSIRGRVGWGGGYRGGGLVEQNTPERGGSMNIDPAVCDSHLLVHGDDIGG